MGPDTLAKATSPFYTTKSGHRGLGLPAVQAIVLGHGGLFTLQSQLGEGTIARILLPSAEDEADTHQLGIEMLPAPWKGEGTVLVIDNEETILRVASQIVEDLGFDVLVARDGDSGLGLYKENRETIRIVILDLNMPGTDGWETLANLRAVDESVLVIVSSGYRERQSPAGPPELSPNGYLDKPYRRSQFEAAIRAVLEVPRG